MNEQYFSQKELCERLNISHVAVVKQLKTAQFEMVKIDGSDKPVKKYAFDVLPAKWQAKLREILGEENDSKDNRHIVTTQTGRNVGENLQRLANNSFRHGERAKQSFDREAVFDGTDDAANIAQTPHSSRDSKAARGERGEKSGKHANVSIAIDRLAILKAKLCASYANRDSTLENFLQTLPLEYEELMVNREKLLRWYKSYRAAIKNGSDGASALADNRGRPGGSMKLTKEQQDFIIRYLLRSDIQATNEGIYKNFVYKYKEVVSYETINRFIKNWKKDNLFVYDFVTNPDKAKGKHKPASGNASAKATHRCAMWELDGTVADVVTNDGKRWSVVALIDVFSRRVCVSLEKSSSSFSVARNLREAIIKFGIPELVVTDNGRDYTSNHFDEILLRLGIAKREVPPFSGECKPHIERFFGTLARGLFREIDGFCGHSVAERQALVARKSFEKKLESQKKWRERYRDGDALAKAFAKNKENANLSIEVPLSADELRAAINNWVSNEYEANLHRGIGMTPLQKWKSCLIPARGIGDNRLLDLLMGQSKTYTVSKKGIAFRQDGIEFIYHAPELIDLVSVPVKCILPDDMGEIVVYDMNTGAFICNAYDAAHYGGSREMAAVLNREYRKLRSKAMKHGAEADKLARQLADPNAYTRTTPQEERGAIKDTRIVAQTPEIKEGQKAIEKEPVILPNGRPIFDSKVDRFVWALENNCWNEADQKLADEFDDLYQMALRRAKKRA